MLKGLIEMVSPMFAVGWARTEGSRPARVIATLGPRIIGWALANIVRKDLVMVSGSSESTAGADHTAEAAFGFTILFDERVAADQMDEIKVSTLPDNQEIRRANKLRSDRKDLLQIFVLGSPRSGTSQLGETLSHVLSLPWLGECHAAPAFAAAASALDNAAGLYGSPSGILRYMAAQKYGDRIIESMQDAYFSAHRSASFVDKTPGAPMIAAAPFIQRAFPEARFIYVQRNGISNVMSRMVKFGGNFEMHCKDWVGSINAWREVKGVLPHFVEVRQEDMLERPEAVADQIAEYIGHPSAVEGLVASIRAGERERTGAGVKNATLATTNWGEVQIRKFRTICGPAMLEIGYEMV